MMLKSCPREKEVKELLKRGQWPQACAPELRAHVVSCRSCGDLILVAEAFQCARAESTAAAPLVSPGALWWRAQLRRRNAAIECISKPILGAQIFALCVTLVMTMGLTVWQARQGLSWLTWFEQLPQMAALHLKNLWPSALFNAGLLGTGWNMLAAIPALATLILLGGVVLYLAAEKQ
jgi:hypothetical protein